MKAVILVAGQGTRLVPHTNDRPKCMVEVRGKPLISHTIATLDACGILDRALVSGYMHDRIPGGLGRKFINPRFADTNMVYSLFCAESAMSEDLLVVYGDILFRPQILQALIEAPVDVGVIVDRDWRKLWERRMEDPLKDAETMKVDSHNTITELGRKPKSFDEIQGQYIGLIKFSGRVIEKIRKFYHSLNPSELYFGRPFEKMYFTDFLQLIADRLMPISAVWVNGGWFEIDSVADYNLINTHFDEFIGTP